MKLFQKGNKKPGDDAGEEFSLVEELRVVTEAEPEVDLAVLANMATETEVNEEESTVVPPLVVAIEESTKATTATCSSAPQETFASSFAALINAADFDDRRIVISLGVTAVSSTLALLLVAYNLLFRRKQRRQRALWKKDNRQILTKVEDLVEQLDVRDVDVGLLEQQLKTLEATAAAEKGRLELESLAKVQEKQDECDKLQTKIDELFHRRTQTDARLEQVANELKKYAEGQQDHECQLLEQKLQASQLETGVTEREARLQQLQQTNTAQATRIDALHQRIKADALKAEQIINNLTSERDDRFGVLQQENDAIKTTVMGLLRQTQEKYDADKVLLKKEMRKRDAQIRTLQDDLWKSIALLKRLHAQTGIEEKIPQSVQQLITSNIEPSQAEGVDETSGTTSSSSSSNTEKERRSSTYAAAETILEGEPDCAESRELQNLLRA